MSIPNILSVFCDQYLKLIIETIKKGLEGLKDQPGDNENMFIKHQETESNLKTVASINKGDLGGVSEAISLDARECEPWMISQGCVWTLAEISKIKVGWVTNVQQMCCIEYTLMNTILLAIIR